MKNVITYLKALWRRGLGSQSSDVSLDCRLTVGSPSVKYRLNLLRLVAISAFLLTIGVGNVWGAEQTAYTLSGTTTGGTSDYAEVSNITQSSKDWKVLGNTDISPWRIGGAKNTSGTNTNRYIYSQTAITENVTKVVVTHGEKSNMTVNSVTLNVYSTAAKAVTGGTGDISSVSVIYVDDGSMTFNRPARHNWAGRFFRIDYDLTWTSSKKAKYILFSSAVFKYDDAPACSAPAAPTISGTAAYTAGQTITLTASCASGADASTTYTWYKGADWATARAASPVQATSTSGATFTKASCVVGDAGKYWCEASNGSGCEAHNSTGYDVTVSAGSVAVTGVSVDPTSKTIFVGETFDITPTVAPANATNKNVSWSSSATSYATVSSGTVTGVAAGSSTITCKTNDGNFTATCAVTVRAVTLQARDEDGNAIAGGGPGAPTRSGATITAAANSGNYVFKQWQVTNASVASTTATPTTISNPTGAVTVTAVYYKPITITYKANGSTFTTQTYARGGTLAFPVSNPDGATYSCTGKTFVGWVGEANKDYSDASTPPTYATAGGSVTAAATYYAVFATASGGGSTTKTDELTYSALGFSCVSQTNDVEYTDFSDVEGSVSDAVYAGQIARFKNTACHTYIQMRSKNNNSGIITTTSGGKAKKVTVTWNSTTPNDKVLNIYGKSTAYSAASDLYDDATDGDLLGAITKGTSTYYTITGDYEYIGLRSSDGGVYFDDISIDWQASGGYTYSDYATNCCTPLGTINGSFTLSSTGTSVTATVTTAGGSAYEDAANVSGYEFKLYTAASGGSASASYSTNSSAGTSHTFTGLTPLTQYWVTVRPIGSGSYCNTTAESDRVAIYTCPGSPNHVDVSGRWDRFGGETISLTAAAYATAGTGTAIPAAKITGYQWQKYYNSIWNDISNGGTISGATTNNLQITNCSNENSGSYRCVVSTVAGCDIASDGFQVKVYALECYNSGTTVYNFTRTGDTQAGTVQIDLSASTNYGYKVHADNDYYGNSGTVNEDVTNWEMSTGVSNNLTVASGLGGTFTFAIDYSTGGNNSTEGIPEISVTYPRKTIYLTPGVWNSGEAKFAFYYFRKVGETIYGEGFTDFITADDCGSSAEIPLWNGVKINAVRLNSNTTASDLTNSANHYQAAWDKKWNQTSDITITSNNSISITGWGTTDSPYEYGTYAVPTYTISYATGSVPTGGGSISGSKANETKTCGVDFDLPAAQFTTTGYVQTGWSKADGGAQYAAVSGSYTDNSAQTFYPVWTANTHTLTWDKNGGDALTGDYTSGTVAYATAITAPNTPTWTGHTFGGWHNGTSIVTPATTMPDNDLSYTAQWSLATYTVTLNTNGGTINAGDVTSYTYGTGATLPTNVTRDGYRFDGWFSDNGVWSDQVTAISTTATGDKTYYAKWTQVYTVTWSVNGETWSSGVVEGNTHVPGSSKVSALPTAPTKSDCDDSKVFVGWRSTAIDGVSAANPGSIFTTKAASPAITGDVTFYAVFADESGGDFTRVTSTSQLAAGKQIVMGYEETANSGIIIPVQSNTYNSDKNILYTGTTNGAAGTGTITISSNPDVTNYLFTLRAGYNSGYWAFEMSGTLAGEYIGYSGKNTIQHYEGIQTDGKTDFSITFGTNDTASIVNKYGTANYITESGKNKYYKYVSYNYNNGNPRVSIYQTRQTSALVLYIANPLVYSNYVTSCSSCDADATFTNTTPAVSDIDCTSATLTATSGLATLGADGCHVSDYGFVIGTSDNPAIGGSGVTKLQVGTSDPTIGEDFSYDATGLTKGTRYYIRAYAINRHGTAYSSSTNFWTNNVSSIAITTAPTKTNYIVGETFDATGMVVTATMADGSTEDVTSDCTFSPSLSTKLSDQTAVRATYSLCDVDKTADQAINVYTLTVTEGTNDTYGTAGKTDNKVTVTGLGDHKTYTVTVTSGNADKIDNGDGTYTITNATGNVTVRVDYADAVQVQVYYKVDGVTVTGLTQDVYQNETTTLPTASELATAMTAQSMDLPDDDYPNFVGWSETEFSSQTSEPSLVSGTPAINAEKTYYAVFTNMGQIHLSADNLVTTYPSTEKTVNVGSKDFKYHYLGDANLSGTHVMQFKKHASEYGYIYNNNALSNILRIEIGYYNSDSHVPVYAASAAGTIAGGALTPASRETTDPYVYTFPASTSYFMVKGDNSSTYKISYIDIYYASSTVYYMTQFCTNRVTLTQNSPEHGTVEFSRSSLVTCGSDKEVSLTILPDVGYQLTGWTVNTATGYADAKTTSPAIVTNSNNSAAQNITLTFAEDANKDYDVTATFGLMTVSSWAWTLNSAAIPDPLNLYVGQSARLDVAYTPAGVDNSKKTYERTKVDAYINWVGGLQATYSTISGKASTGENTTAVTFTHADGPTTTVNVKVLPLPLVHFGDIVHNVEFADVVATLSDNTLSPTKTTPTHADFDGATKNTCEEQHLHLVGWIREDWPALVNYLNGTGDAPTTVAITGAGDDASGNAYFFAPGASINTQTFNGVTFYAVWAKVE